VPLQSEAITVATLLRRFCLSSHQDGLRTPYVSRALNPTVSRLDLEAIRQLKSETRHASYEKHSESANSVIVNEAQIELGFGGGPER
jgi:hypothetical protein